MSADKTYQLSCWLISVSSIYPLPPADYPGLKKENKILPRKSFSITPFVRGTKGGPVV